MSSFQELLEERNNWTLDSDNKLFEKIRNLEFNIFQSAEAIHQSFDEMRDACKNTSTSLNNALNTFNFLKYTKFVENAIDKGDRPHLKDDEDNEGDEETQASEHQNEKDSIKLALSIAYDAIGISSKAAADDLLSLAENEEADHENDKGGATHRRKGLKLPAIYGSKQYTGHTYLGMVEIIKDLENDDTPPDLIGEFDAAPAGFDDPFKNDPNGFNPDEFNPPPANGTDPLFSSDAFNSPAPPPPPPGGQGPPPPPPPPGPGSRTTSLPPPPPPQRAPPPAPNARTQSSDDHLPPHLREINRLKLEADKQANLLGDPSEAGSFLEPQNNAPMPPPLPPVPGRNPVLPKNPNDSYDPYSEESLFIGGNALKDKYNNNPNKNNIFNDSAMGGGLFDQTMGAGDLSVSMDQDLNPNNLSKMFDTRASNTNRPVTKDISKKMPSGNLFDKIDEDNEESDEEANPKQTNKGGIFDYDSQPSESNLKPNMATKGFLDDSDEEEKIGGIMPKPNREKSNMFDQSMEESESSMLFPTKAPQKEQQKIALPGLANPNPQSSKAAPFNYGQPSQPPPVAKKGPALFDEYEEEESMLFNKSPQKKPSTSAMFTEDNDPNESMIFAKPSQKKPSTSAMFSEENDPNESMLFVKPSQKKPSTTAMFSEDNDPDESMLFSKPSQKKPSTAAMFSEDNDPDESMLFSKPPQKKQSISGGMFGEQDDPNQSMISEKSFIEKQLEKGNTNQNKMAMIMQDMKKKNSIKKNVDESRIGDSDEEDEPMFKPKPPATQSSPKPPITQSPPKQEPPKKEARMFLDESHNESMLGSELGIDILEKKPTAVASQNKLFMEDDEEEESFFFNNPKPTQTISKPPPVIEKPKASPNKGFMFNEDDEDDEEELFSKKKTSEPATTPAPVAPPKAKMPEPTKTEPVKVEPPKIEPPKSQSKPVEEKPKQSTNNQSQELDEQTKRLGFLAMMTNPGNKPPPAFLTKQNAPSDEVPKNKTLEMNENAQLDKPIIKRNKKRRGKANPAALLDVQDDKKKVEPPKPAKVEPPKPVKVEPPKPAKVEPPKPQPAKVDVPKIEPKIEEKKVEQPKNTAKKGFLDDSDDDSDDDFFAKKTTPKPSTVTTKTEEPSAPQAPMMAKRPLMFESDDDDDDDDDDSFD